MPDIFERIDHVLAHWPELRVVVLFGSVAAGKSHKDSDIDLAVQMAGRLTAKQKAALISDLAIETGQPIDLVDLREVGQPLLGQIVEKGIILRGGSKAKADLLFKSIMLQEDFAGYQKRILEERRKAWIES